MAVKCFDDDYIDIYAEEHPLLNRLRPIPIEEYSKSFAITASKFFSIDDGIVSYLNDYFDDAWYIFRTPIGRVLSPEIDEYSILEKVDKGLWVDVGELKILSKNNKSIMLKLLKSFISNIPEDILCIHGYIPKFNPIVVYKGTVNSSPVKVSEYSTVFVHNENLYIQAPYSYFDIDSAKEDLEYYISCSRKRLGLEDTGSSIHYGKGKEKYFIKVDFLDKNTLNKFVKNWKDGAYPSVWVKVKKENSIISLIGEFTV